MANPVDEIRSKLSIEEVVGSYVQLKKTGSHFKALCPFHQEKTPSFVVSPEKQIAYCFGCNKGGDMFTFIQELENVDFKEALKILADKAGVAIEHVSFPKISKKDKEGKERMYELLDVANKFFIQELWKSEDGQKVLEYLKARNIKQKTIRHFQLGFAPDSFGALHTYLFDKGFTRDEMLIVGLVRSKDTGGDRIYDYFRRRLIFPIFDIRGRVVAFGARALKKGDDPKYLNSPETPVYHKGKTVYGLNFAKQAAKTNDSLVFVEGYMDVMASHQAGIEHVAASSGTALTRDQLQLVKRFTSNLVFAFDADTAGLGATERGIEIAQTMDFSLKIVRVSSGKDPADFIQSGKNDAWCNLLEHAEPYLDFCFRTALESADPSTETGSRKIQDSLLPIISRISNTIEQDRRVKKLANILSTEPKFIYEAMATITHLPVKVRSYGNSLVKGGSFDRFKMTDSISPSRQDSEGNFSVRTYEYFFGLLYQYPKYFPLVRDLILEEDFPPPFDTLYKSYVTYYNNAAQFDSKEFLQTIPAEYWEKIVMCALQVEVQNAILAEKVLEEEMRQIALWIRGRTILQKRKRIMSRLRQAQDSQGREKTFQEYCEALKSDTSHH